MPPLNPAILQAMMQAMGGGAGGPGGPSPGGMPGMGGPPMPGGGPPMGGAPPGGLPPTGLDQLGSEGVSALDGVLNTEPSGELKLEKVRKALDLAHQLILASLPIVGTQNMDLSKQLHILGRQLADTRMNLSKENEAGVPPEQMIGGIQGTGLPGRI